MISNPTTVAVNEVTNYVYQHLDAYKKLDNVEILV